MTLLKATKISKTYTFPEKIPILREINFEIHPNETVAIIGRSGEGKSTLLHILGTLEASDSGTLEICNQIVHSSNAPLIRSKHIGFIFQSHNLLEDFTVLENVLMPAKILRLPVGKNHGLHLLDLVGLIDRAHFPLKLLSGGEKQRVAIARALCNNPSIILADEPTGNLDQENSLKITDLLFRLACEQNRSLILVTHDLQIASRCTKEFHLQKGSLSLVD